MKHFRWGKSFLKEEEIGRGFVSFFITFSVCWVVVVVVFCIKFCITRAGVYTQNITSTPAGVRVIVLAVITTACTKVYVVHLIRLNLINNHTIGSSTQI
jgi:hypothetical protein